MIKKIQFLLITFLLLLLTPICVNASTASSITQAAYDTWKSQNYGDTLSAPVDISENEMKISGTTGTATILESDLYLPGKNGLDVNILREYDSVPNITYDTYQNYASEDQPLLRARYKKSDGTTRYIDFFTEDEMFEAEASEMKVLFNSTSTLYMYIASENGTVVTRDVTYAPRWTNTTFDSRIRYFDFETKGKVEITDNWSFRVPNLKQLYRVAEGTWRTALFQELNFPNGGTYTLKQVYSSNSEDTIRDYSYSFLDTTDYKVIYPHSGAPYGDVADNERGINYAFIIQDKNGKNYYFSNYGKLVYEEDRFGNGIKYQVGSTSFTITDSYGRVISYTPDDTENNTLGKLSVIADGVTKDIIYYEFEIDVQPNQGILEYNNKYHLNVKKIENDESPENCNNVTTYTMVKRANTYDYALGSYGTSNRYAFPTMLVEKITKPDGSFNIYTYDSIVRGRGWIYAVNSEQSTDNDGTEFSCVNYAYNARNFVKTKGTQTTTLHYDRYNRIMTLEETGDGYNTQERYVYVTNKSGKVSPVEGVMQVSKQIFNSASDDNYDYVEIVTNYKRDDRNNITYENYMGKEAFYDYGTADTNPYNLVLSKTYENEGVQIKIENTLTEDKKNIASTKEYVKENDVWTEKSYTSYEYDSYGNLVKETLRPTDTATVEKHYAYTYNGAEMTYESYQYNDNNQKVSAFSYFDKYGREIKTVDANGNETTYEYDNLSRLKKVTNSDNTFKTYAYDVLTNSVSATNENGTEIKQTYDMFGRERDTFVKNASNEYVRLQAKVYNPNGYLQSVREISPGNGETLTEYNRDDLGRAKQTIVKEKLADGTFSEVSRTTNTYTDMSETGTRIRSSRLTSETKTRESWNNYTYKYEWNTEKHNVKEVKYVLGRKYDYVVFNFKRRGIDGEIRLYTDATNYTLFDWEHGSKCELSSSDNNSNYYFYCYRSFIIDVRGLYQISIFTPNATNPSATFNMRAYKKEDIDALTTKVTTIQSGDSSITPPKTEQTFDFWGNLINAKYIDATTNTVLREEQWTYDDMGNNLTYRNPQAVLLNIDSYLKEYDYAGRLIKETVNDEVNGAAVTTTTYDKIGRAISVTDPMGNVTQNTYDNFGRVTRVTYPIDTGVIAETRYTYDNNGNVIAEEVKNGSGYNKTEYAYDNRNRVSYVTNYKDLAYTSPEVTQYTYDNVGNILRMYTGLTAPLSATQLDNEGLSVVKYEYDFMNYLTKYTDAENQSEVYTRDYLGNKLTHKNKGSNSVITYTYNWRGLPLKILPPNTSQTITYEYDALGNRTKMTDSTGETNYTYSSFSELLAESKGTTSKTYTYDKNGQRTSFVLSDGDTTLLNNTYTNTSGGLLTSVVSSGDTAAYTYDKNGNMLTETINGTVVHTNTYNNAGKIKTVTNKYADQSFTSFSYGYNTTGNVSDVYKDYLDYDVQHVTYTYDGMGRLTSEDNTTYTYDLRGNRATKSSKIYSYTIDNRILNSTINGTTYDSYMYSGSDMWLDGEYEQNSSHEYMLSYDTFKRVKQVQRLVYADTGSLYGDINYTYNGDNQRVSKEIEDDNFYEEYIWDGDNIVMTKSGTNITVYKRGLRLFASDGDNGKKYYNYNGHGDVVELIDATGNIIKAYDYDAFGNEHTFYEASDTNPFRYCGEFYDTETRYIYLRARYYSPRTGRFISEDPARDGLNWYVYANNNPLKYTDPTGLSSEERLGEGIWSFKNDKFGVSILSHWLFGGGTDYVQENGVWGTYMKDNSLLKTKVQEIVFPLANDVKNNSSKTIDITTSMEIQNGEDIIGYQYLHGTNADVGGFQIKGTVSKNKKGDITYDLTYTWNDKIDPNFMYYSDSKKAEFAKSIPLANPTDYTIRITWSDKTVIKANPTWYNWNKGWLK